MGGLSSPPGLPTLTTTRLRLEPVGDEHLELMVELNGDPDVMRYQLPRPATPEETRDEWARRLGAQSDPGRGLGYWAGFEDGPGPGEFAGWWSASSFAGDPATAGLGYRLRRAAWGRGLATEGARAMVAQAFRCPDVLRVVASTMAVNTASRAVLTKVGMAHVDSWVQEWDEPVPGAEQGEVLYELTRTEWEAR